MAEYRESGIKFVSNHGVDARVEYPERVEEVRHRGTGTRVRQPATGDGNLDFNWVHLALPAETYFDTAGHPFDEPHKIRSVRIQASLNENAIITTVDVREGGRRLARFGTTDEDNPYGLNLRDPEVLETFDFPDERLSFPSASDARLGLAVCVRVAFLDGAETGRFTFRGAGAFLRKDE